MIVRAEIQYMTPEGWVHSDIDFDLSSGNAVAFAMACFSEWMMKSNGTGYFYMGDIESAGV